MVSVWVVAMPRSSQDATLPIEFNVRFASLAFTDDVSVWSKSVIWFTVMPPAPALSVIGWLLLLISLIHVIPSPAVMVTAPVWS